MRAVRCNSLYYVQPVVVFLSVVKTLSNSNGTQVTAALAWSVTHNMRAQLWTVRLNEEYNATTVKAMAPRSNAIYIIQKLSFIFVAKPSGRGSIQHSILIARFRARSIFLCERERC
eukprot:GEMP01073758.1.p1 GENE.GEMP01073758.1~~GEMP01073758.1.p1  ORF type:complete len:116 (+),score=8.95 GEMP01073758.1:755-1102(+)